MSGQNAAAVRKILELLSEGKVDEIVAGLPDDAEWDATGSAALRGLFRGPDEIRAGFVSWMDIWESWAWEPEEVVELDAATVLITTVTRGTGRGSGVEVTARGAHIWTFRDGQPVKVSIHQDRDEALRSYRVRRVETAVLYFVCEARPGGEDPRPVLDAALRGGAGIVQLREKELDDQALIDSAAPFRDAADEHGALFVLNDRPDLVEATGADGVHVGQDDMSVAEARAAAGPGAVVGLSTHTEAQIEAAESATGEARPDQISVGPIWETPTKEGRPATGLGLIEFAAREASLPWFAIGGVDTENVDEVARAGARRAVVVRAIRDAADPESAARRLTDALAVADRKTVTADG